MFTKVILLLIAARSGYCQYGSYGGSSPSASNPSPSASSPSPSAPSPSGSGNTVAPGATTIVPLLTTQGGAPAGIQTAAPNGSPPSGPVTTVRPNGGNCDASSDSVYQGQISGFNTTSLLIQSQLAANPNAKPDNSSGFYLGQLAALGVIFATYTNVSLGQSISGADCLSITKQVGSEISFLQLHANDSIAQPPYGDAVYQNSLQQFGASYNTILASAAACKGASNPGQFLQLVLNFQTAVTATNNVISSNDSSANCASVMTQLINALFAVQTNVSPNTRLKQH